MNGAVRARQWELWKRISVSRYRSGVRRPLGLAVLLGCFWLITGCTPIPRVLSADEQHVIDRHLVECPAGYEFRRYVTGLTAPTAEAFDANGSLYVAEGQRGEDPRIWKIGPDGKMSQFYPHDRPLLQLPSARWQLYGPIGGMLVLDGKVIVTHRDENDFGVVTALDSKGGHTTLCAGFPAQGDHGLTDIAVEPRTGRLWFGCGTATNSGVVGEDNFDQSWPREHPDVHDIPWHDVETFGYKFTTSNPYAGLFGPSDIAVTGTFQAFSKNFAVRVKGSPDGKPNGAIFSIAPGGGFPNVEGTGFHYARGIAFNEFGAVYFTNDGMEMIGSRPIKGDPDSFIRLAPGQPWGGWPDYTTNFDSVSDPSHQPPLDHIATTGYAEVRPTIDQHASGLTAPFKDTMLEAAYPSLSGAAKFAFCPWKEFQGSAIIALSGDRSPYASGGIELPRPVGFKVIRTDLDRHVTRDFIRNVGDLPGSKIDGQNRSLIERPVDIKFGPDGAMYMLDEGYMEMKHGREVFTPGTGQIFRLVPIRQQMPTTRN